MAIDGASTIANVFFPKLLSQGVKSSEISRSDIQPNFAGLGRWEIC